MRTNYNRTTGKTKTLGKKNRKPLDVNDVLIEIRRLRSILSFHGDALPQSQDRTPHQSQWACRARDLLGLLRR